MNLNSRPQILGLILMGMAALLGADHLLVTPLTKLWKERATRITELKKSVEKGARLAERDRVLRERWDSIRTNSLSSEVSVAENQVFRAFDRWSQASRISVNGIKPQWKRNADDYATLECRVDAAGSLPEITRFLYEIEKDTLGLKMEILEVTARDDRGQQLTVALQVSGLQLNPPPLP